MPRVRSWQALRNAFSLIVGIWQNFFATGLPPRAVALGVIESMKQDAGYIFTNRELHGATDEQAATLRAAYDACLANSIFDGSDA